MNWHQVMLKDVQVRLDSQLQLDINTRKNTKYDFCFELLMRVL